MALTHYRLPLDEEFDKDIIKWINGFSRTKKGEMVRHAIRYYLEQTGESKSIQFPKQFVSVSTPNVTTNIAENSTPKVDEKPRKKVSIKFNNLK